MLRDVLIVSFSFISCQKDEPYQGTDFSCEAWSIVMSGIEKLQFAHAQIRPISNLGVSRCFYEKFVTLLTIPKIHEKILNRSADIKILFIGKGVHLSLSAKV